MILPAENKLILVKPFICAETLSAQNTEKTNFPKIKKSVVCVYTPSSAAALRRRHVCTSPKIFYPYPDY